MISDKRAEELRFLIRNKVPIRMTDEVGEDRFSSEALVDTSDLYTLRDLIETDIISIGHMILIDGEFTITVTAYTDLTIMGEGGDVLTIEDGESINIAVEEHIIADLHEFMR